MAVVQLRHLPEFLSSCGQCPLTLNSDLLALGISVYSRHL